MQHTTYDAAIVDSPRGEFPGWALRYASHFGFLRPDDVPLFNRLVNSDDPRSHARFTAEIGFQGMQYTFALQRPASEVERFASAMDEFGLESSCILYAPVEEMPRYRWGEAGESVRQAIIEQVRTACVIASKVHSRSVNLVAMTDSELPRPVQKENMARHLRAACHVAADHGLFLTLETMKSLPNMLSRSLDDSAEIIQLADHPAATILFDTFHAYTMGDDLMRCFCEHFPLIGLIQLKNYPGRLERGKIDYLPVLVEAIERGYRGLVELENHWLEAGPLGECTGLVHIQSLDRKAQELSRRAGATA